MLTHHISKEVITLKIAGYARISVDLQEDNQENTSIENQKRIIEDYIATYFPDAELHIYEDRDRSGYTFAQRENYQIMRRELMSGSVKILIIKDFSRFSRRNGLGLYELETLRDAGVRIISIGDGIDYPTRDEWMLIQVKFLVNEMPVTETSKKARQIITNRQKNGKWICAVPYGYRITNTKEMTYEIDPPAAEVVREIFRLYTNGWGYKKIANYLTEQGIPTPRANEIAQKEAEGLHTKLKAKTDWSIVTISSTLQNDFYIGTLRQKKYTRKGINGKDMRVDTEEQIVFENVHDPIVDTRTFLYAQEQLKQRSKSNYRGEKKYATDYSGVLFCGDCGSPMFSMSRPDLAPAYTCGTYHRRGRKGCTSHHIRVDQLDELLRRYIRRVQDNSTAMLQQLKAAIADQPDREEQIGLTMENLDRQLQSAKEQLKTIYKRKVLDSMGKSESEAAIITEAYADIEKELTGRIEGLEKQLLETNDRRNMLLETNRKAKTVMDVFENILRKPKLDRRDIGLIVERITVYEGRVCIRLRSDVDALLRLDTPTAGEDTVNFPHDSKDIVITQKSAKRADKVFTVNVINSGDPLEIFTEKDGEVVFKKYSPVGELSPFAVQYADVLSRACNMTVLICDRDHVIAAAGSSRKDFYDRRVSAQLEEIMDSRQVYVTHAGAANRLQPVEAISRYASVAAPIVASGDVTGIVCLLQPESGSIPSEGDVRLAQVAAAFLGKQMEE